MKKYLLLILLFNSFLSFGQIKNNSEVIKTVTISKYTNTMVLSYTPHTENYFISFLSTNKYDSSPSLSLGNFEESLASLDFFIAKIEEVPLDASIEVEIGTKRILFTATKYFGKVFMFSDTDQAGISYMHPRGLKLFKEELIEFYNRNLN